MAKVCHVTSVHRSNDIRIFVKECTSLAAAGYDMYLVAPGDSKTEGAIKIIGCGEVPAKRSERVKNFDAKVYEIACAVDADIYHFHDPEMLKYAAKLKKQGKKVIFDSHEDVPAQIESKPWIPAPFRGIISAAYKVYETKYVSRLDAVVTATDYISEQFHGRAKVIISVKNYPRFDDIRCSAVPFTKRSKYACYAGGISYIRGETIMASAMKRIDGLLKLAGVCEINSVKDSRPVNVDYLGRLNRDELNTLYSECRVGLCLLLPVPNHLEALPTKIFEYMASGLPVVVSDFFPCSEDIEKRGYGKIVDVSDEDAVVEAIRFYLNDPEEAEKTGEIGHKIAVNEFNWLNEGKKLLGLYAKIV